MDEAYQPLFPTFQKKRFTDDNGETWEEDFGGVAWRLVEPDDQETRYKSLLPACCNAAPRWETGARCHGCNEANCPSPTCACVDCKKDLARERLWILVDLIEATKSLVGLKESRRQLKSLLSPSQFPPDDTDRPLREQLSRLVNEHIALRKSFCDANPDAVDCLP